MKPILITSGEPAGVGPELCAQLCAQWPDPARPVVALGDAKLLQARAKLTACNPHWVIIDDLSKATAPGWYVKHVDCEAEVIVGRPSPLNAAYVLRMLDIACDACIDNVASAMVTAPIQKSVLTGQCPGFMGHTEYLAERCGTAQVVMMLAGGGLKVALATTHIALSEVPSALTTENLTATLRIVIDDLRNKWGIPNPRVLVTGLNPHAGEDGTMGLEEIEVITPVIKAFQQAGEAVTGPWPADTLFQPKYLENADAVLAMYHDQGLPVLKFASFGQGVNITLGLPIIRTSVDHGTALDLAGTGKANTGSLKAALEMALNMVNNPSQRQTA